MFKDAIGREWQLATIQCDFNLPERFDLSFVNEKGEKERPVVIHRAISGSLERFMGVMIEHFSGNFPAWVAPVQVKVIPVGEKHEEKAREVVAVFRKANVRAELGGGTDGFGKRIREAKTERIPYFIIIGDKDIEAGKVTLESRDKGQVGQMTVDEVLNTITGLINSKA
jgi:threonyl-tRNA synthetase